MQNEKSIPKSAQEALDELAAARDEAKVRLHLLSMEARQRWQELEVTLVALERKLCSDRELASEGVLKAARDASQSIKQLLRRHAREADVGQAPSKG